MSMNYENAPVIIGGNGHSGTRLFADICLSSGISMGVAGLSYAKKSKDLNVRGLMNKWMRSYMLGLDEEQSRKMENQFRRRIRLLIPFRDKPWGFKNPRSMFLLPMYHAMFPDMKFIHVIRDGRDMCFGNPFIETPTYWGIVPEDEAQRLSNEERMMKFWGEANRRVKKYCETELPSRYTMIRFEDICDNPEPEVAKILELIDAPAESVGEMSKLVRRPSSIGRWKTFDEDQVRKVVSLGEEYLAEFGYA